MSSCDLASKECEPCKGGIAPMTPEEIDLMMPAPSGLDPV